MPAIITHYTYAKEAVIDKTNPFLPALYVGASGPDPFFFYGQRPWARHTGRKNVNAFGVKLHHMDITDAYFLCLDYASKSSEPELLYSYIEGLFLHYTLDRNCHPYIFSRAGFAKDEAMKKKLGASHSYFETILDVLIGKQNGTFTEHADMYIKMDDKWTREISKMWDFVNKLTLKEEMFTDDAFYLSLKDYQKVLRLTNIPHYGSYLLTLLMGKNSVAHRMNYPRKLKKSLQNLDFLNENHSVWLDPVTGKERTESFDDLMKKAEQDYQKVYQILQKIKENQEGKVELRKFVNNIDHDGFQPSDEKKFMSPIWPTLDVKKL